MAEPTLLEKVAQAQREGFLFGVRADWERRVNEAYNALQEYIIVRAGYLEPDDSFSLNDDNLAREVYQATRVLVGKELLLLKEKLENNGIMVGFDKAGKSPTLRIIMPKVPDKLNIASLEE